MNFAVVNLGCKVNRVESDDAAARLALRGVETSEASADLIVVNTCTVTGEAEKKTRKAVRRALRANDHARVLVTGCAAAIDAAFYEALDERVSVVGKAQLAQAIDVLFDEAKLKAVLGDDLAAQLVQAASASDDAAWIAAHPDAYAMDGDAVQYKLLKLAAVEPEAVPFVRTFPDAYPAESALGTDDPASGEVPRLYQWDQRWGSTVYSSTTFALTGCCPTSLSMVYQGLTGKGDLSPYDMGKRASDGGFETAFDGTDSSFLVSEAASLGLSCEALSVDAGSVRAALEGGAVLVCNVGPGDFTDNGHFFVVTGIDGDGNLRINDPYSAERSNRAWDVDTVLGQTKALWAYRLA